MIDWLRTFILNMLIEAATFLPSGIAINCYQIKNERYRSLRGIGYMIKKLTEDDFDDAIDVIRNSFMTVAEEFNITKENAPAFMAYAIDKNKLRTWMFEQSRPMYGYFDNGKMVGYYNLMIKENECELGSLSVLPEYRHKSIGRKLLEDSLSKASGYGCTIMKLSIVEENKILRKWYEDQGFIHTGTIKYDFFPFTCGYLEKNL